jgi:hypothetical protein
MRPCHGAAHVRLRRPVHAPAVTCSGVQGGLFLRGGKCPCGARAALLAEYEAQLLRGGELGLGGAKSGAWLGEIQGTEHVASEIALLACDLAGGSLALLRH